jgi:protein SCO1
MKIRVLQIVILIISCIVLGAVMGIFSSRYYQTGKSIKPDIAGLLWPNPKEIGPFKVLDQDGNSFGVEELTGKWSFLFFGYTHCPDVCPVTLTVLSQVYNKLAEQGQADNIQIIFVSVDPERDTPDVINSYVKYFNNNLIGLTGNVEQISSLARQIGIAHVRGDETAPGEYLVDHTASVFLISPVHKWLGIFSVPHTVEDIISRFQAISNFINHLNT